MFRNTMPFLVGALCSLFAVHIAYAQPAISMERDPATGRTRTLLAGQIKVPPDWKDHDMDVDNNVFSASMAGTMKKGQAIPAQISDDGMRSTVSAPITVGSKTIRCPQIALIKPPGGANNGSVVVLPGILKVKIDLAGGSFTDSDGKHFRVKVTRPVKAGESIPVLFLGDFSIFSVEPASAGGSEPWFTASLSAENRQTAIQVWRAIRCQ